MYLAHIQQAIYCLLFQGEETPGHVGREREYVCIT